jgi:hypothetical protein
VQHNTLREEPGCETNTSVQLRLSLDLGVFISPDHRTGSPVGTQGDEIVWALDTGLQSNHVPTRKRVRDPHVVGRDDTDLGDPVLVDPAVGVRKKDLVSLLHRREVEALVEALAARPTDPVAGYISVSPFPKGNPYTAA